VTPACADPLEGDHVVTRELQGTWHGRVAPGLSSFDPDG
jgi:hypothetical protein